MAEAYTLASLINTTDSMTQLNQSLIQDTLEIEGTNWYIYAGNVTQKIYVHGKGSLGFGVDEDHLCLFCGRAAISNLYRQEGSLDTGTQFLKLRVEGKYYTNTTTYTYIYEVFLFDDGNIYLYVPQMAKDKYNNIYGTCSITDGKSTKTVINWSDSAPVKKQISNAAINLTVENKEYKPIAEIGARLKSSPAVVYIPNSIDWSAMLIESYDASDNTNTVSNFNLPEIDVSSVGTQASNISYKTYSIPVEIEIKEDTVTEITSVSMQDHYQLNEKMAAPTVKVKWGSGKTETLTSGYEVTGFDSFTAGSKKLIISYKGATYQVNVYISQNTTLKLYNPKTQYYVGDIFSEPSVYFLYDDGYERYASNVTFSGFNSNLAGNQTITVTANELSATYGINVSDVLTRNIGSNTDTDIVASLNLTTGVLTLSGTGDTTVIYSPSRGSGGLFDDGGAHNDSVKEIIVEDGITGLIGPCFSGMSNVTTVTLPEGLKTIGESCFQYCRNVAEMVLPKSLESIGNYAFYDDSDLTLTILSRNVNIIDTNSSSYPSTLPVKMLKGYIGSSVYTYAQNYSIPFTSLNKIVSMRIKIKPSKLEYWPLETVSVDGLVLSLTDEDGIEVEVNTGYTVEYPDMSSSGEKTVTIAYGEFTDSYKITVTAPTFEEIKGTTTKMSSGKTSLSLPWFMFDGEACNTITCSTGGIGFGSSGTKKITIMADKFQKSSAYVLETVLDIGIRVGKIRFTGKYYDNYRKGTFTYEVFFFSTGDIYITISGNTTDITSGWNGTLQSNGNTYKIYGPSRLASGQSVSVQTSCYHKDGKGLDWSTTAEEYPFPNVPKTVKITTLPEKQDYFVNDSLDMTGSVVTLIYSDGSEEESKGYTINEPDMNSAGIKQVTVTDTETGITSEEINIYVNLKLDMGSVNASDIKGITDIRNKSISLIGSGTTKDYEVLSGPFLGVCANFDIEKVTIDTNITGLGAAVFPSLGHKAGNTTIIGLDHVKTIGPYCFYSAKFSDTTIDLADVTQVGDHAFNASTVKAIHIGTKIKQIDEYAFNAESLTDITIYRAENSVSGSPWGASNATVTWINDVSGIKVTSPKTTKYITGEEFDKTGLMVLATFSDGTAQTVDDYTITSPDMNTPGKQTLTVTYRTFTATVDIEVLDPTGVEVTKMPEKTIYYKKESLDTTGLVISAVLSDGSKKTINNYTLSDFESRTAGEKTITVQYRTFSTSFNVTVNPEATELRIVHYPKKMYYKKGEKLDTTGLEVALVYEDGTETLITDYTLSEFDSSVLGSQDIDVTYGYQYGSDEDAAYIDFVSFQVVVTADGKNPYEDDTAQIKITVHWPNGEFKDLVHDDIVSGSMSLKEGLCEESYFIFGGCLHNMITFDTHSDQFLSTEDNATPHGKIEVTLECNGTAERIFTGVIDSGKRQSDLVTRRIIAYDELYKYRNADISRWYENNTSGSTPAKKWTQKQFRDNLFKYLGIKHENTSLYYDKAYVPTTSASSEINVVNVLKDLCLQNSVFGWMDRYGIFRYMKLKENGYLYATNTEMTEKYYKYYESEIHIDTYEKLEFTEGRIWYPYAVYTTPDPNYFFTDGGPSSAQEAYEMNYYYNRDSFFVGDSDWLDEVWELDEDGYVTREEPKIPICYGVTSKVGSRGLYMAQGYNITLPGNPSNKVGQTIEIFAQSSLPDGTVLTWIIHSYIMSRTLRILGDNCMEDTYSANNAPYNGNNQNLGKYIPKISAETYRTRSESPVISYADFSDGTEELKKTKLRCMKRISEAKYKALVAAKKIKKNTLYLVYKEEK